MQRWVVISCSLLALVSADVCPDGGRCKEGQTCCNDPADGYECCPFDQAECCEDHEHCCPAETLCDTATSSCVNSTVSIPWAQRASASRPSLSKSFRMIKSYIGEEDDNICPDQSRCPAEFSCLRALTRFGCCPLAQGVPCTDGKHCCPEGHQCSLDGRSCMKKDLSTVLCGDGKQECPDGTTCCESSEGVWGCCLLPKAVCCADQIHCCPEGTTCDTQNFKCVSLLTKKVAPMWAKFPARIRAEWENQKDGEQVTAKTVSEKTPEVTTTGTVPPTGQEASLWTVAKITAGNDVPCNSTAACPDGTTCCKTAEGGWACCPLPEAVCCADFIHCCPKGKKCNLAAETCDDETCSVPLVKKVPTIPWQGSLVGDVVCDATHKCPDETTCCKNAAGDWACCPLPKAVCCND
ncbi:granulin a, partial [Notolabrus celidotus]|uniref:granulin a n=1 Tax=Notolabrus celidotus TaxID=1203425 RepID=UPI00148F90C2